MLLYTVCIEMACKLLAVMSVTDDQVDVYEDRHQNVGQLRQ